MATEAGRVAVRSEHLVQVGTVQREAGADITPQCGEVDVGQQAAAVVAEALMSDQRSPLGNRGLQAKSHSARLRCRVG